MITTYIPHLVWYEIYLNKNQYVSYIKALLLYVLVIIICIDIGVCVTDS